MGDAKSLSHIVVADIDKPGTCFDQSPRQERTRAEQRATVALTHGVGFPVEIKSRPNPFRSQQVECDTLLNVELVDGERPVVFRNFAVELIEQPPSG